MLDFNSTISDILEFKFLVLFATVVIAIVVGNWLYDKREKNDN